MKRILLLFLISFSVTTLPAQTDKNGNPVFNSELISEEKFPDFELVTMYYNIRENISNKRSSVYVNDHPSLEDYIHFARNLPAIGFVVRKGQTVIGMIMLVQKNNNEKTSLFYNITNPVTGESSQVACNVWGEINEKRADELLKLKVDPSSDVIDLSNNGKGFLFDRVAYRIQSFDRLKKEVIQLAGKMASVK